MGKTQVNPLVALPFQIQLVPLKTGKCNCTLDDCTFLIINSEA